MSKVYWFVGTFAFFGIAFAVLRELYWFNPEKWNPIADSYFQHVKALKSDSVSSHKTIVRLKSDSVTLSNNNGKLQKELDTAIKLGEQWQSKFNSQVIASDAFVDRIKENERDLELYKSLYKNGTLKPVSLTMTQPKQIDVTTASLKTAKRLELSDSSNNVLSKAFGVSQAAVVRLRNGLQSFNSGSKDISINLRKKGAKKTFLNIGGGLKKAMIQEADRIDSLRQSVEQESELEKKLNKNY